MLNKRSIILEGLANKDSSLYEGVKADVRNKKEALMVIELLMKDFDISIKEVNSLFESVVHEEVVGNNIKLRLEQGGVNCSLSNISLKKGWGEREIKNTIENCERTPESVASTLNASDWIVGKDWKKSAGSNDKTVKLKATDSFGNKMFLYIKF